MTSLTLCCSWTVLLSGVGVSVELGVLGYESELAAGDSRDLTDWIVLRGAVTDRGELRVYRGISLDVEEALALAPWLVAAAAAGTEGAGEVSAGAVLQFSEPDVAVQLLSHDRTTSTTRWTFYDPAGPLTTVGHVTLNACVVDVVSPRAHLQSCAEAWGDELSAFLAR